MEDTIDLLLRIKDEKQKVIHLLAGGYLNIDTMISTAEHVDMMGKVGVSIASNPYLESRLKMITDGLEKVFEPTKIYVNYAIKEDADKLNDDTILHHLSLSINEILHKGFVMKYQELLDTNKHKKYIKIVDKFYFEVLRNIKGE